MALLGRSKQGPPRFMSSMAIGAPPRADCRKNIRGPCLRPPLTTVLRRAPRRSLIVGHAGLSLLEHQSAMVAAQCCARRDGSVVEIIVINVLKRCRQTRGGAQWRLSPGPTVRRQCPTVSDSSPTVPTVPTARAQSSMAVVLTGRAVLGDRSGRRALN